MPPLKQAQTQTATPPPTGPAPGAAPAPVALDQDATNKLRFRLLVAQGQMSPAMAERLLPGYADRPDMGDVRDPTTGAQLDQFDPSIFQQSNWNNNLGGVVSSDAPGMPGSSISFAAAHPDWTKIKLPPPTNIGGPGITGDSWLFRPPPSQLPGSVAAYTPDPALPPLTPPVPPGGPTAPPPPPRPRGGPAPPGGGPTPFPGPGPGPGPLPLPPTSPVPPPGPIPPLPPGGGGGGGYGGGAGRPGSMAMAPAPTYAGAGPQAPRPIGSLRRRRTTSFAEPTKKRVVLGTL
jgi:hypothetical protein